MRFYRTRIQAHKTTCSIKSNLQIWNVNSLSHWHWYLLFSNAPQIHHKIKAHPNKKHVKGKKKKAFSLCQYLVRWKTANANDLRNFQQQRAKIRRKKDE